MSSSLSRSITPSSSNSPSASRFSRSPSPSPSPIDVIGPDNSLPSPSPSRIKIESEGEDIETGYSDEEEEDEIVEVFLPDLQGSVQTTVNASRVEVGIGSLGNYTLVITNGTASAQNEELLSTVVDLSLFDSNGNPIQPNSTVRICFEVNKNEKEENLCLASYKEDQSKWECDDKCLKRNNDDLLCGDVDHFTNFAVLLTGDNGDDACGDNYLYITGSSEGDLILILVLLASCCCFVILLGACSKRRPFRDIFYSQEALQVSNLRNSRMARGVVVNN